MAGEVSSQKMLKQTLQSLPQFWALLLKPLQIAQKHTTEDLRIPAGKSKGKKES